MEIVFVREGAFSFFLPNLSLLMALCVCCTTWDFLSTINWIYDLSSVRTASTGTFKNVRITAQFLETIKHLDKC